MAALSNLLIPFLILLVLLPMAATQTFAQQSQGSVATVDSRIFAIEITEYKRQIDQLNREFEKQTREVQDLAAELRSFEIDLNTNRLNYSAKIRQERTEILESMRKKYQRKSEDLEEAAKKRADVLLAPVKEKIMRALNEYSQARGIVLVLDIATAIERGGLIYVSPGIDITAAFIEDYNRSQSR
ncbi:MAG: OmpH family outer membrane protein [Acidobacteriota bacterium]